MNDTAREQIAVLLGDGHSIADALASVFPNDADRLMMARLTGFDGWTDQERGVEVIEFIDGSSLDFEV